jgi:hypothetical protein
MNIGVRRPLQMLVGIITSVIILGDSISAVRNDTTGVNDDRMRVVQDAPPCLFEVRPGNLAISAGGGTSNVSVSAMDRCPWRAASNADWITVTSPAAGNGNGSVTLSVARNSGAARFGDFTVAGQTFTITQDAAGVARSGDEPRHSARGDQ